MYHQHKVQLKIKERVLQLELMPQTLLQMEIPGLNLSQLMEQQLRILMATLKLALNLETKVQLMQKLFKEHQEQEMLLQMQQQ